jgi:hypothetical protein
MRYACALIALVPLLLPAAPAAAQARDGDWVSYRDAYRAMVVFDKYGGAKNFIQHHLQVIPKDGAGVDGLQLTLAGKSTQLHLPLDATGRAVFPLLKAAYDENAVLVLNRKAGHYLFRPRVSIAVRHDGEYEVADLRAACEQALGFARHADASEHGRHCGGVRFVFQLKSGAAPAGLRRGGVESALPVVEGGAFVGDPGNGFATVTYRFAAGAERAKVVTHHVPLAIAPLFD